MTEVTDLCGITRPPQVFTEPFPEDVECAALKVESLRPRTHLDGLKATVKTI